MRNRSAKANEYRGVEQEQRARALRIDLQSGQTETASLVSQHAVSQRGAKNHKTLRHALPHTGCQC